MDYIVVKRRAQEIVSTPVPSCHMSVVERQENAPEWSHVEKDPMYPRGRRFPPCHSTPAGMAVA
eukprot:656502-Amphidinium_carterae.2